MAPTTPAKNLETTINARNSLRVNIETAEVALPTPEDTPLTEVEVDYFLTLIKNYQGELLENHKRIEAIATADVIEAQRTEYRNLFMKGVKMLARYTELKQAFPQPGTSHNPTPAPPGATEIRLPRLQLPTFNGNLHDWVSFRDMFSTAVHNNNSLSKSQKFTYLKSQLHGEAARLLQSMTVSDENYDSAWSQLAHRYQNDREILFATFRKFMNQSNLHGGSASSTRQLIDTSKECMRSLDVLKLSDKFDSFIMFQVFTKLDPASKELWEQGLKDSSIPTLQSLFDFLEQRARALAASAPKSNKPFVHGNKEGDKFQKNQQGRNFVHHTQSSTCKVCEESYHPIYKCNKFHSMSVPDRIEIVKKIRLCSNCFRENHSLNNCPSTSYCRSCNGKHNSLLHRSSKPVPVPQADKKDDGAQAFHTNQPTSHFTSSTPRSYDTILATASVLVPDVHGQQRSCRVFVDNGSSKTYITESCIKRLGIPRSHFKTGITGLGENCVGTTRGISKITITPHFQSDFQIQASCLIVPKITGKLPQSLFNHQKWDHLQNLQLADPNYHVPGDVDILLGAEFAFPIIEHGKRIGPQHSPTAINSSLGWLIGGGSELGASLNSHSSHHTIATPTPIKPEPINPDECLDGLLRMFWELETVSPQAKPLTVEEEACESHFKATYQRDDSGRFTVQIPFKSPQPALGSSLDIAIRRLKSLERRLNSQSGHKQEYVKFMQEYEQLGHMVEIPSDQPHSNNSCYIPHHFVLKESSTTTKLRVVFDASAQTTSGVSLNDTMMVGPSIQDNLADIIMRFRLHKVAFTADIAKMYRQILIAPEHQDFQRIVWREDPSLPIKHYKLVTVTYGTASAPFLATRVLQELAVLEKDNLPLASEVALRDHFVDDLMSGSPTDAEALEVQAQIIELAKRGGLQLRKWISNSQAVLESLPPELRESVSLLSFDSDDTVKTLGILWNPLTDHFLFKITPLVNGDKLMTKRSILSEVSKVFDPIGWLAPVIVRAKLLMQEIWKQTSGWDDALPHHITSEWTSIKDDLPKLEHLKIDRHQGYSSSINKCVSAPFPITKIQTVCLVGFCDASERAYAAATYLCIYSDSLPSIVTLINSKTRVAPIKQVSLPRLELCGAVLLAELMVSVQSALRIPFDRISAWTDSTVVLGWIRGHPSKWKNFVANRVTKIQNRIPSNLWGHVRGQDNPADCASRGIDSNSLINHNLWWTGPQWLQDGIPSPGPNQFETQEEERQVPCHVTITSSPTVAFSETILSKFSSLTKLQRFTAWIFRIIRVRLNKSVRVICINKFPEIVPNPKLSNSGPLSAYELDQALMFWVKKSQNHGFGNEIKLIREGKPLPKSSKLLNLSPYVDFSGVLRVGGRLRHAKLPVDQKHPILLSRHGKLTQLMINSIHINNLHAGPQLLLSILKRRFWVIRAKDIIRWSVRKCVVCARLRAETLQQVMADLPEFRVTSARAFLRVGIDYAGPFQIKPIQPRSKVTLKAYLALFVCCTTRALHLEIVSDLSTDAFLAALRRFVSRRGRPTDIYSDCGTNFVGADRQLREMQILVKSSGHNQKISNQLSNEGIQWHFNPPAAPHFGGLWEAGVKSVKYHLRRVMGSQRLTFEELTTATSQIEACLNSRPLTPESTDPADFAALTPGHFLIGSPLTAIPEPDLTEIGLNRLSRWQLIQQLLQHFWRRWSAEYISRLQQRPKWMQGRTTILRDDMVIIKDENHPPMKWRLGRVTQLHPGHDGITRVVTLKTADGEVKRPIVKLCLLPIDNPNNASISESVSTI